MSKLRISIVAFVIGIAAICSQSGIAAAWHPQGDITKTVQNLTTNSQTSSATTASTALTVAPGDKLLYTVTVSNTAAPADDQYNDMTDTVMTDTLPTGVELIDNPAQRQITENLGTIAPGSKITKQYQVKVANKTKESDIITNKACYSGNSLANDNPQSGCATAVVKVHVPPTPSYSCDLLTVTRGNNRTVTINSFQQSTGNGATFENTVINWGDNTTPLTSTSPLNQTHQYSTDGTYRIVATAHFSVNGTSKTATSDACSATTTFTTARTPTPPTKPAKKPANLPNAGAGDTIIGVTIATILGYAAYALYIKRRVPHA